MPPRKASAVLGSCSLASGSDLKVSKRFSLPCTGRSLARLWTAGSRLAGWLAYLPDAEVEMQPGDGAGQWHGQEGGCEGVLGSHLADCQAGQHNVVCSLQQQLARGPALQAQQDSELALKTSSCRRTISNWPGLYSACIASTEMPSCSRLDVMSSSTAAHTQLSVLSSAM